jgi:hypothetical protein
MPRLSVVWNAGVLAWLVSAAIAAPAPVRGADLLKADSIRAVPVHRFDFESASSEDPSLTPEELSGIVWVGGDDYLAVGDAHATVHRLTIRIDGSTGAVRSATMGAPIPLFDESGSRIPEPAMAEDREGIAYDTERSEVWIADEQTGSDRRWPSIARHRLSDGRMTGLLRCDADSTLAVFEQVRPNRGFESLARAPDDGSVWTANEDALRIDGPPAGERSGAVVRLLKLDRDLRPVAQFAYPIDSYSGRIRNPAIVAGKEINGLSELIALPGGRLLALERSFAGYRGGNASLRSRLYLVDVTGATDISGGAFRSGLVGRSYVPARKVLLWQENWGLTNSNFEGMTLGPELSDGSRVLILIADNNAGSSQALFTLRLAARRRR